MVLEPKKKKKKKKSIKSYNTLKSRATFYPDTRYIFQLKRLTLKKIS